VFSRDPWAEVLRKVWGGFRNGLTGMGFIFLKPVLCGHKSSPGSSAASSCLRLCIPDVDFLSLILTFYHLVSIRYRWLSGRADFGLWPLSDLRGALGGLRLSVTPRGGVWRKFSGEIFQALETFADFVSGGRGFCCIGRASRKRATFRKAKARRADAGSSLVAACVPVKAWQVLSSARTAGYLKERNDV
jgi:hypothetical protein